MELQMRDPQVMGIEIRAAFLLFQASTTAKTGVKKAKEQTTVDKRPSASNLSSSSSSLSKYMPHPAMKAAAAAERDKAPDRRSEARKKARQRTRWRQVPTPFVIFITSVE